MVVLSDMGLWICHHEHDTYHAVSAPVTNLGRVCHRIRPAGGKLCILYPHLQGVEDVKALTCACRPLAKATQLKHDHCFTRRHGQPWYQPFVSTRTLNSRRAAVCWSS